MQALSEDIKSRQGRQNCMIYKSRCKNCDSNVSKIEKCRDLVKLGTVNGLDLLAHPEYRQLQAFFDSLPVETDFEQ